jgi:hypothetical protein
MVYLLSDPLKALAFALMRGRSATSTASRSAAARLFTGLLFEVFTTTLFINSLDQK